MSRWVQIATLSHLLWGIKAAATPALFSPQQLKNYPLSSSSTMKFASIGTFALAAFSVAASPVAQAEQAKTVAKRDVDIGSVVGDVESLLGTIVKDVESIASAAGLDLSTILKDAGITLAVKRDEITGEIKREVAVDDKRDLNGVVSAVETLIGDVLASLVTLAGTSGVSLISLILSLGL